MRNPSHGYGSLINGEEVTYHHNLYAHHSDRVPRPAACLLDFRNNALYDFGGGGYNHAEATRMNYVGNYIIPQEGKITSFSIRKPYGPVNLTRIFFANNFNAGSKEATDDNRKLLKVIESAGSPHDVIVRQPIAIPAEYAVKTETPHKAYERILAEAGATLPKRDPVDTRVVEQVRARKGKIINAPSDVGGYPEYKSAAAPADADQDGMADEWETKHGFSPKTATEGNQDADQDGYTNLEEFLNGTDPRKKD